MRSLKLAGEGGNEEGVGELDPGRPGTPGPAKELHLPAEGGKVFQDGGHQPGIAPPEAVDRLFHVAYPDGPFRKPGELDETDS